MLGKHRASESVLNGAKECYRVAVAAMPTAGTYLSLGLIQQQLGEFDACAQSFSQAVRLAPNNARARVLLGNQHFDNGQFDEATEHYQAVIKSNPLHAEAHYQFSRSRNFRENRETQDYLASAEQLLVHCQSPRQQKYLHFAIAKVRDDLGDYDRAWTHYQAANQIRYRRHCKHNVRTLRRANQAKQRVDTCIDFFTQEYFDSLSERCSSKLPVFIVGMPRSGTTLTEQILSSHPDISGAGELIEIDRLRRKLVAREHDVPCLGSKRMPRVENDRGSFPEILKSFPADALHSYANDYLEVLEKHRQGALRVTDKMPTNFMHLGLIATLFPQATIIHCRRNPLDVFVSSFCQNLNPPFNDMETLVDYYHDYLRLMKHWEQVLPIKIHSVDYESLIENPEVETRRMIEHCGLTWDAHCLNFTANDRAVRTPSKWQVRQPLYSSSVNRWKRFEKHLLPIVAKVLPSLTAMADSRP
jgi:tetratricopeptide (TPR) repeat protein